LGLADGLGAKEAGMGDPFDLERFVVAQDEVYPHVVAELSAGEKRSHWMWFVFPQMRGLGNSSHANFFGIGSLDEAEAYWKHPVLGPRLQQCTLLVNLAEKRAVHEIFGSPDDLKFRSSMTLFARAAPETPIFSDALEKYFAGEPDPMTMELMD
jgi:uncharacterized protein (DUF1810 family)